MTRRVLGIVDSDSFVKWGASLLRTLPDEWETSLVAVNTLATASDAQIASALGAAGGGVPGSADGRSASASGTSGRPSASVHGVDVTDADVPAGDIPRLPWPEVVELICRQKPEAVLVATRGPIAEVLIDEIIRHVPRRPVIVTGLPGISTPAKWKGLFLRAQADLFVLHSHREIREYRALAAAHDTTHRFGLSTLPFLPDGTGKHPEPTRDRIVFASQPTVPAGIEARRMLVGWLAETARAHPYLRVVIKVRAVDGEGQTHKERHPYADLLPADAPKNLVVEGGSMAHHLERAVGLVTVSSTATLEAVALDVPCLVLSDFGVSGRLINEVFLGSGLIGSSHDLIAGRFKHVVHGWREDNYFHPAAHDDWADQLEMLVLRRAAYLLHDRASVRASRGGPLRRAWERKNAFGAHDTSMLGYLALAVGTPLRFARNAARAILPGLGASERVDVLAVQPEGGAIAGVGAGAALPQGAAGAAAVAPGALGASAAGAVRGVVGASAAGAGASGSKAVGVGASEVGASGASASGVGTSGISGSSATASGAVRPDADLVNADALQPSAPVRPAA